MAKRKSVNKSAAIREALQANPDWTPKQIAESLKGDGIRVTGQYVSIVKSAGRAKVRRKVQRRRPGQGLGQMGAAVEFIRQAGGLGQAQDILRTIEAIKGAL